MPNTYAKEAHMPSISKRTRKGGDLPNNPADLKLGATEAPVPPVQLELVPEAPVAPEAAPAPPQSADGCVIVVSSCKLKERKGKDAVGKSPVYRGCMGKGRDGKNYWWPIEMNDKELSKGDVVSVSGKIRSPFGEKGDIYPIDTISCVAFEETEEKAKVSAPASDELFKKVSELTKEHGNYAVLQAFAETLK